MLRSFEHLRGYHICVEDGEGGKLDDLLFDDETWTVQYAVVQRGSWLRRRHVLVSPEVLGEPEWRSRRIPIGMTRHQLRSAPLESLDPPVSRSSSHGKGRGWLGLWPRRDRGFAAAKRGGAPGGRSDATSGASRRHDPHLRSAREVAGYRVMATDDGGGELRDMILDDSDWRLPSLVIDTGEWVPGKRVLLPPDRVQSLDAEENAVVLDIPREALLDLPKYSPMAPVNTRRETRTYDYYGRPLPRFSDLWGPCASPDDGFVSVGPREGEVST